MQTLFSTADIGLDDVLSNASTVAKFMTLDLSLPSKEVEALVHSTVNVQMVSFQSTSTYLGGAPEEERKMSLRWLNKFTCMLHGVVISFFNMWRFCGPHYAFQTLLHAVKHIDSHGVFCTVMAPFLAYPFS